ncbi:putative transposase-associated domain-containing protein, partial [Tanacetum coccineum]
LFKIRSISEDLRWHATWRIIDGVLRHPADSQAWRTIDDKFPKIAEDPRNLRLGISDDGVDVNIGNRHHKKNVGESLVETLLNVPGKTKDGVNARLDLLELGIKPKLFARQDEEKTTLPPAGYTLTNAEKDIFCETKEISLQELDKLQAELVVTLCLLEKFFPPSFFDIMIHLTVHLTREVKLCGPICFRWMYPFERCMKVIKGHVRNRNRPEGCIAEKTITEETIEFFSEYHKTMKTVGIPPEKHNTDELAPYIERHKQFLITILPGKRIALLESEHNKSFSKWLREEVERELEISKDSVSDTVRWISYGPRTIIVKYEAYNINGYTFCTKSNDGKVYQNSGVSVEAADLHISKEVATIRKSFYYGVLQEIWVLDYYFRQIPLFKCDWVNHKASGVKHDKYLGYTLVDLNSLGHKGDPFILASQARQVFYVKDQLDKRYI